MRSLFVLVATLSSLSLVIGCDAATSTPTDGGTMDAPIRVDGGGTDGGDEVDGGRPIDGGGGVDAGSPDAGSPCGPDCPPGWCFEGECISGGCCVTGGACPRGLRCDFESCGCVPATGCCAGEACPGGEICDFESCTCGRADDCCRFGRCEFPMICDDTCGCTTDTSCSPACTGDSFCFFGSCTPRCVFEGCPDGLYCSEAEGCVAPRCTGDECLHTDPPMACDPGRGCFDPCVDRGSDFTWCTDMGGRCVLGECIDDTCGGGMLGCAYVNDCCGNVVCWDTAMGSEPFCDPSFCPPEPRSPVRPDLCLCAFGGRFFPFPEGGGGGDPPPPGGFGYCADLGGGERRFPGDGDPPPRPIPF